MNDFSPSRAESADCLAALRAAQAKRDEFDPRVEPFRILRQLPRLIACAVPVVAMWLIFSPFK